MLKQVRVNIRSVANVGMVRTIKRDGRELMIVPSVTLPDDIVMNGIKYPADEIEAGYKTLERSPAPYGHPVVNGKYVSAKDPEGINITYIGAWNENARRENGRVFLDKVIDTEVANRTQSGKSVIDAVNAGEPVHTSTGLICDLEPVEGHDYDFIARNMNFDHDAILLNEDGAATPLDGVGMLVNGQNIEVINSSAESAMRDLDWAVESAVAALDKLDNAPLFERIKSAILGAFAPERETTVNTKDTDMTEKNQFDELSAKVNALAETVDGMGDTIAKAVENAVKPLTDNLAEMQANQKAKDDDEKTGLINSLVKTGKWTEEDCAELTINALRKLAEKETPGKAAAINAANPGKSDDDEWAGYDLNANIDGDKEAA